MPAPLLFIASVTAMVADASTSAPASIAGRYLTEDGAGIVEVSRCDASWCGRLIKILKAKPGAPRVDVNNRNPSLRGRPILGMPILSGFSDRTGEWRGTIYDPRNGKSYKSIVRKNADGSLKVQGCIAVFCQSQRWTTAQ